MIKQVIYRSVATIVLIKLKSVYKTSRQQLCTICPSKYMVQLWKHGKSSTRKSSITLETVIKQHGEPTMLKNMGPILANAAPTLSQGYQINVLTY